MSEAMIMCASTAENIEIIDLPAGCVPGDKITFEGYSGKSLSLYHLSCYAMRAFD